MYSVSERAARWTAGVLTDARWRAHFTTINGASTRTSTTTYIMRVRGANTMVMRQYHTSASRRRRPLSVTSQTAAPDNAPAPAPATSPARNIRLLDTLSAFLYCLNKIQRLRETLPPV
ncbi:unnamed protein product [Parnassius mnemosyne]|uniref:Uncharacterized protein n=1 Tax=Parnassius mnemosyne TaxID=213953 RepID=A0AAV1M7D3_9NEOP